MAGEVNTTESSVVSPGNLSTIVIVIVSVVGVLVLVSVSVVIVLLTLYLIKKRKKDSKKHSSETTWIMYSTRVSNKRVMQC